VSRARASFASPRCIVLALAVLCAPWAHAAEPVTAPAGAGIEHKKPAFGPWDAGTSRAVSRQGTKGKARRAHPFTGTADKVPGEGPPPPPLHMDPDVPETALDSANVIGAALSSNPLFLAALIYANFLTKVDGPRCQHMPTCSRFANQAVAKHGLLGILMGLDRVIAPGASSALRMLPEVHVGGQTRHYDPVDNYEIWKSERFTGFPPATPEEPLALPALTPPSEETKEPTP
jgi:putative component of membrane protein insertase Oxa1/YidC/SpoIIIJ protein YidD